MALSLRQGAPLIIDIDDQAPGQSNNYVGRGWAKGTYYGAPSSVTGFYNNSMTLTNSSGDYFWFSFNGSKATIIGCNLTDITNQLTNSSVASSISLYVDGIFAGLQETFQASDGRVVCGETPQLPNGAHTINATVVTTNPYLYCIDYFEVATDNSSSSSSGAPGPTSSSTGNGAQGSPTSHRDVGAIAGGVVGGIIILAALIIMCCLLSRRRRNRQSQGNEQSETALRGTVHTYEPSPSELGGSDSLSPYSDKDSNNPLLSSLRQNVVSGPTSPSGFSDVSELGLTFKSGDVAR